MERAVRVVGGDAVYILHRALRKFPGVNTTCSG